MVKDGEASRGLQNDELENIRLHFSRCPNRDARCIRLDNLTLKKLIIMRKGRMGSNTVRFSRSLYFACSYLALTRLDGLQLHCRLLPS